MKIDLTVAVTAHAEDFLLRPTLRSVAAGLDVFIEAGRTCELLVVLDRPTAWTRREALRWRDDFETSFDVRTIEVDHGESGASRNSAVAEARGSFLSFVDGDDLVSRDFFEVAFEEAESRTVPTIVHPEQVLSFGGWSLLWNVGTTDDPALGYRDLLSANQWPSCSLARLETYEEHPYPVLEPGSGFGPEDYAWNIATIGAGIDHVTARDTAFFYRVRTSGGVNNAHVGSVLPAFDLDALRTHFPHREHGREAASPPKLPLRVRMRRKGIVTVRPMLGRLARAIPEVYRVPLRNRAARVYHRLMSAPQGPLPSESLMRALKDATELEPALSWTAFGAAQVPRWEPDDVEFAEVLEGLVGVLSGTDTLVLAPWLGVGGADMVTLNYAGSLAKSPGLEGRVSLLTTYLPERTLPELIPADVRHTQLDTRFRAWPLERQQRLIAQLVVLLTPRLIISVNCFDFTSALAVYSRSICAGSEVYLTLFAFDRIGKGAYPVNPISDDPQRSFLLDISGIITDNTVTASIISDILGVDEPFVRVHHQSAAVPTYDFDNVVKQTAAYYDTEFSEKTPFRVMWPHRLDKEKRPDALVRIAERARTLGLPMEFHVYGQRILENGAADVMPDLTRLGVTYHGPYSGGLPALPTEEFHALLLTSESEGMPLVLAQSLLLGLPVVASDVGGVGNLISHRETGMLTSGPTDTDGFVGALTELMDSRTLRQSVIRHGYDRAAAQHGIDAFAAMVEKEFGPHAHE
ncbi:MAG: glycosyltransferase [Demequinaceae bacterium]|nr:glycosyltransferase [Demequinaceae bacterium]